jgi:hypothetical protein
VSRILSIRLCQPDGFWVQLQYIPHERWALLDHVHRRTPRYFTVDAVGNPVYWPQPAEPVTIEVTREEPRPVYYTTWTSGTAWIQQQQNIQAIPPPLLQQLYGTGIAQAGAGAATPNAISAEAERRARDLLLEHLNETQRDEWTQHRYFTITGSLGTQFRLSINGCVRLTDLHGFCLQVVGERVPEHDAILARKLLIESDEEQFLRTANDLNQQRERHLSNCVEQPDGNIRFGTARFLRNTLLRGLGYGP